MAAFSLLSRGGSFNKKRFQKDVERFNATKVNGSEVSSGPIASTSKAELPSDLDFFKYARKDTGKRKATKEAAEEGHDSDEESQLGQKRRKLEDKAGTSKPSKQRVVAKGTNVPSACSSFEDMQEKYQFPSQLMANLESSGYLSPTGIQENGIPILLESRDLAAISPTGTGKTLAYLLPTFAQLGSPIAHRKDGESSKGSGVRAVVLAPTNELAHQIHNECLKLAQGRKWRMVLFSKATASTLADKAVREKIDIIISTPLRLVAALQSGHLELDNVRHLILDEADRLLDSEFLEQVNEVIAACSHPELQKAVFSATLPANAEKVALGMMRDPVRIVVGLKDTPLPLIAQSLTYVQTDASKLPTLVTYLSTSYEPPVLIFTSTQSRASSLAEQLVLHGISNVDCLHAGMTKKEREDTLKRMRAGESWVLISTEVMARGMDFKGVRGVINYDFPTSVQSYVHRIGRTGRAGREGTAITYFTDQDAPFLKAIANVLLQSGSTVPEWILKLPKASKLKRRQMGKVKRGDQVTTSGRIGRADAIRKRFVCILTYIFVSNLSTN
ncbi:P-loop containing nucleoside triphosphate hydrolase protein [Sistotremastrum suecicum HHB10207 ss-3]|uniref:RNA helicase n=1 Tax=Sistotremastrum suecicum HHB10207 ss-3 TaxID=1314776 RepID=A0A166HJH6_9AGAM|nr:P-loop containing nucleoside triphosphate hydrolase protein [Sistotremastrum suecicum HHB10207 ss-3]